MHIHRNLRALTLVVVNSLIHYRLTLAANEGRILKPKAPNRFSNCSAISTIRPSIIVPLLKGPLSLFLRGGLTLLAALGRFLGCFRLRLLAGEERTSFGVGHVRPLENSFARAVIGRDRFAMPKGPNGEKRPADVIGNAVQASLSRRKPSPAPSSSCATSSARSTMTLACFQVASSCILPSIMTAPVPSGIASRIFGERDLRRVGANTLLAMSICVGCSDQAPTQPMQEGVAELRLAGGRVGEVAERAVERLDAVGETGVDHAGERVVPQVLLEGRALGPARRRIGDDPVLGMAAADARRLHAARGGEIGRPEAHAVHARAGGGDGVDVLDALGRLQDGMDQDRLRRPRAWPRAAPAAGRGSGCPTAPRPSAA